MLTSRLARSGLSLTKLGLGASQMGNLFRKTSDDEAHAAFDAAWAGGIRYFDVAPHYGLGLAERRLGSELRRRDRDEFVVSTKVGRLIEPDPGGTGRDPEGFDVPATSRRVWDFSRDGILRSIDDSLGRLGLDRIDIVYLHDPDDHWHDAIRYAVPTLVELRDAGVIRAFGVGMNQSAMPARFVEEADVDLVMLAGRYTLLEQGALADLMPLALDRGVGVVIAAVYNSGILASDRPPESARYDYGDAPSELIARAHQLADLSERRGVSLPTAALHFPFQHPAVVSVVVGARNGDQVEANLARFTTRVPDALWDDIAMNSARATITGRI